MWNTRVVRFMARINPLSQKSHGYLQVQREKGILDSQILSHRRIIWKRGAMAAMFPVASYALAVVTVFLWSFFAAFSSPNTIRLGFQQVPLARNCLAGLFMEPLLRTPRTITSSQEASFLQSCSAPTQHTPKTKRCFPRVSLKTWPLFPIFVPAFCSFPLPFENRGSHVIAIHAATKLFAHGTCGIPAWRNQTQARLCANL